MQPPRPVAVLEHDPDLATDLSRDAFAEARGRALAAAVRFPRGGLTIDPDEFDGHASLGLLVIDGLLVRKVTVGPRACAELLGPGDVLQPWLQVGVDSSVPVEVDWDVAEGVTVAVLDRAFALSVAQWPEIATTIASRIMARSHWLAFQLAVCHIRGVEERLVLVLWHIADRWGKVTPRGVEISIKLPHWLLAYMTGVRRPAVTLGLNKLMEAGVIDRLGRSRWMLCGEPPTAYHQLHADAGHRHLTPCSGS